MEPQLREPAGKQKKVLTLTWSSSIAALVIYLLLPWFVSLQGISSGGEPYEGFRTILWFLAFIQVGVVLFWTRRVLRKEAVLRAVQGTAIDPLAYYTGRKIAAIGMAQSVALYGLVLAIVGGYFWDQYILTLIAGALVIGHYPSRRSLDAIKGHPEAKNS
jgi:hypothetical protein